ncbi:hypothetical protein ACIBLB_44750 [Streptosporangium canum]|uniref:hypothetical protein n=1 Tax=Streptosporangium canum TaxID=324952 RepID=UPI0037B2F47C
MIRSWRCWKLEELIVADDPGADDEDEADTGASDSSAERAAEEDSDSGAGGEDAKDENAADENIAEEGDKAGDRGRTGVPAGAEVRSGTLATGHAAG